MEISFSDKRKYRHITLDNRLDVVLIQDPETDKSAACCNVKVGSFANPPDAEGLAHFLEHMLFLGTEKYPTENGYSSFLSSHGGGSNAYTAQENTVYYFDIQPEHLEEALDMFSSFFTCPLFSADATERELNAVDSENSKNLQSDPWRNMQLLRSLAKPGHPATVFATGNLRTLKEGPESRGVNIRDLCIQFYDKHYSANLMKVVIYGREDLDVLEGWARSKFAAVSDKDRHVVRVPSDAYGPEQCGKVLQVVPVKDVKAVDLHFPIPSLDEWYRSKPGRYLGHLIGHEADGSILSALKEKGLANGLSAYAESYLDYAVFNVSIDLTDRGVTAVDEVIGCVFAYVGMLLQTGPQLWVLEEMQKQMDLGFRFQEKYSPSSYSITVTDNMHSFPPNHFLSGENLVFDLDLTKIPELVSLLRPDNCIIFVKHKQFKGRTSLVEPLYGTEYNSSPISSSQMSDWMTCLAGQQPDWNEKLHLPQPNPFVPTKFDLAFEQRPYLVCGTSCGLAASPAAPAPSVSGGEGEEGQGEEEDESVSPDLNRLPALISRVDVVANQDAPCHCDDVADDTTAATAADGAAVAASSSDSEGGKKGEEGEGEQQQQQQQQREEEEEDEEDGEEAGTGGDGPVSGDRLPRSARSSVLWFKQDSHWKTPKACVKVNLDSPLLMTCSAIVSTNLLANVLKEEINQFSYYASCAGLRYNIQLVKAGIELTFDGYNDKLSVLVLKAVSALRGLGSSSPCSEELFARVKEDLLKDYKNSLFSQPYNIAMLGTYCCVEEPRFDDIDKFNSLRDIDVQSFRSFTTTFLAALKVEVLVVGNSTKEEAETLSSSIVRELQCQPLPSSQWPTRRRVFLQPGINYVYRQHSKHFNPAEVNSAIHNVYFTAEVSTGSPISDSLLRTEATLELVSHLLQEPSFNQLRTQEQLGYIVHASSGTIGRSKLLQIIIQSSHKDPVYLDGRIETFLSQYFSETLSALSASDLTANKDAVVKKLTAKPKNLREESGRWWEEVRSGEYLFNRRSIVASHVRNLTLEDVVDYFRLFVLPSEKRIKLSSQLFGNNTKYPKQQQAAAAAGEVVIGDVNVFKRSMPLLPLDGQDFIASLTVSA